MIRFSDCVRYKGRWVKKKEVERREKLIQNSKSRRKDAREKIVDIKRDVKDVLKSQCRFLNLVSLVKNLVCQSLTYQQTLSLNDIVEDNQKGLHTRFLIECVKCSKLNVVDTGEYHQVNEFARPHLDAVVHNDLTTYVIIETSGRSANTDMILPIAAQLNDYCFSVHITPTQSIDPSASVVNGLTNVDGTLHYQGNPLLFTVSTFDAMIAFYEFLNQFEGMCLLTAHNVSFDRDFLLKEIINHNLVEKFAEKVYGFSDALSAFRKKFPERKGNGSCTLKTLAIHFLGEKNCDEHFHEATYDVDILHKLVDSQLSVDLLLNNANKFDFALRNYVQRVRSKSRIHDFDSLKNAGLTCYMLNKLASSDVTYEQLKKIYEEGGEKALKDFLAEDVDKKPRLTKKIEIIEKIINHFKK